MGSGLGKSGAVFAGRTNKEVKYIILFKL